LPERSTFRGTENTVPNRRGPFELAARDDLVPDDEADQRNRADPEFHKRETTLLGSRSATITNFERVMAALRRKGCPTH
jgi:hypothetical protein